MITTILGNLNVGDQILVIDGFSLIDVTHDYAGQLFKQAMERKSVSECTIIKRELL